MKITRLSPTKLKVEKFLLGVKTSEKIVYQTEDRYEKDPTRLAFVNEYGSLVGGYYDDDIVALNNFLRAEQLQ